MAEQSSLPDLHDRLDQLWVGYLNALDIYTQAQAVLQKHMSAGFLSLARANFNTRDIVTRYGKDFYHERAVATKRVAVVSHDEGERPTLEFVQWEEPNLEDDDQVGQPCPAEKPPSKVEDFGTAPQQQPSPPTTPAPDANNNDEKPDESSPPADRKDAPKVPTKPKPSLPADPIRWFGILVPQNLRSAQASFKVAVDDPVLDAVAAARSMRDIEADMRKVRKEIRRAEKSAS